MEILKHTDPVVLSFVHAVRTGDVDAVRRLLDGNPGLASKRVVDNKGGSRTALHVVTDWPGYFPNGPVIVKMLIEAGADPNAPTTGGKFSETPLHWAASNDDVDVAAALIDGGADIEVLGGSIAGGTPLDNAVGYGCWNVARLLVQRGARVEVLWHAAALGMMSRVEELMASNPSPKPDEINAAFWHACHGGQRRVAEYLLSRGADINATPDYTSLTPLDAAGSIDTRRDIMVTWLRSKGAKSSKE
ncbi:ankyrin repeat domain-containing protein [Alicyclobacillus acidocaldarius]|uniref:Ankyrin n=1 Tax=Alicyclobacillus acidocaldarius subsp. acidocaldarius (strain ATCC 27009 / DSM 446 / BCRC 14685 / JCM 5260 / KCTC 1825 / NBRC 15652 / NCIMB 11725 / NRRL B-14509 / 104-IA) TaxID=521098 RepID=C8WYG5_ALIAD|nr:ankyrin repeat domain-containing protein [Alicyclobacillus acidocaldarius]ACV60059.1 Ankyrin [Alicyclobacillus acidocaldarius subsp. acidocaldarius DSM 446]